MQKLLVATKNKGKLVEFQAVFGDLGFKLIGLDEVKNVLPEVRETGETFEENACIKAVAYGDASGELTIADDSGLIVDALNGRPGVYSARYAPSVNERNVKLLTEMEGVPDEDRIARFVSVTCLYNPENKSCIESRGEVEGAIAYGIKGEKGFGYDPVFFSFELNKTFGEASDEEKNSVSHRARALEKLKEMIKSSNKDS
jgi:XTP/dITP diphosphohydrolase